jgi:isopentenyl phosphate kinase
MMRELTLIKLGGSLITDKTVPNTFRSDVAARVAQELTAAYPELGDTGLIIGHGSGSFGHVAARQYRTIEGVQTQDEWRGFAHVARAAAELNHLLTTSLASAGLPVISISPSASGLARDGRLTHLAVEPLQTLCSHGIVPVVHGDVCLDEKRGGTIVSTEAVFFFLARHLHVTRIFLLGEVDGVYDQEGRIIDVITPETLPRVEAALGASRGVDVTGGMDTKVRDMVALVTDLPHLAVRIFSGLQPGLLRETLLGSAAPGTLIAAHG